MLLDLKRTLVFLDCESTGTNPKTDRVVQIALLFFDPDKTQREWQSLVNPLTTIPQEAIDIHGITNKETDRGPTFLEIAPFLLQWLDNCDLAGYNLKRFDIPLLQEEFARVQLYFDLKGRSIIDVQQIFFKKEPRTLEGAVNFYCSNLQFGRAHDAMTDTKATAEVFDSQLQRYTVDIPRTVEELHEWAKPDNWVDDEGKLKKGADGRELLAFGKWNGYTLQEVAFQAPDYLQWILDSDFSEGLKQKIKVALVQVTDNKVVEESTTEVELDKWVDTQVIPK